MTGKVGLQKALNHQEGPVPIDFGGTSVTGMHADIVSKLRDYYGLDKHPVKIHEPYQMLGMIEDDLKEALKVSVQGIFSRNTLFGFPIGKWKEWSAPWGQDLLVPDQFETSADTNNNLYIYPEGDTTVAPSGKMVAGGYFFDATNRQEPINDDLLNPNDNLEEFTIISDTDLEYLDKQFKKAEKSSMGIIASFGGTALGDIALIPGLNLKHPKGIRDVEEWYISTVIRRDYLHKVFDKQSDIACKNLKKIYNTIGDKADTVFICGNDFGTQESTFCSPETFDELYLPYYQKMNNWIHENTNWKTFKHSDGAIFGLIPNLIKAGFDVLNPVQISAKGMNPARLKKEYGNHITFWGAGVDTQHTLHLGTPEEVRREVLEMCEIFAAGGGFVFNTIHNIVARTPIKNVIAMIDAVHEFNGVRT